MKNIIRSTVAATSLVIAMGASAVQYSVQIGAHKFYKQNNFDPATQHGTVHTDKKNNITKVRVGFFDSKDGAEGLLGELKKAGYEDAFITEIAGSPVTDTNTKAGGTGDQYQAAKATVTSEEAVVEELDIEKRQSLSQLSPNEFSKAVYVDGVLMIRENDKLLTLEQYRKAQ